MVFLLSIDTEGFELNVLKGALETLNSTACAIIEKNENDFIEIESIMKQAGFKLVKSTHCNLIWLNEKVVREMKNT